MANEPVTDRRDVAKPPEPVPEKIVGDKGGAAAPGSPKRAEKFEIDAVTQEQEGGAGASEPEK